MTEQKGNQPLKSLIERQVGEILEGKKDPVSRLAQFPSTLAGYFNQPGTAERMITHGAILAIVVGATILTPR